MGSLKEDLTGPGVELVETHTAWVFLGEETVWKVKKPVDFGFLNFTTFGAPQDGLRCRASPERALVSSHLSRRRSGNADAGRAASDR